MKDHNIAVIPGDGIGEEVAPEGVRVLDAAGELTGEYKFQYEYFPYGCKYYLKHGRMMADDALTLLKPFDAIYFGAVGFSTVPDHISLRGLRVAICQGFEQYVCYRPCELLPGIKSPLADKKAGDFDFIVIRENTEGEYTGAGGRGHRGLPIEVAVETSIFTRIGIERIVRYAYKLAQSRRKKLISATKSNAQQHSLTFWDEMVNEVGQQFPDVSVERVLVDALSARFIMNPESLDVVVATNLHGDILTDIAAAISGSLGIAPSGNINPEREYPSMFEPVHGSAIEITGQGIANPIAMIWCGAMMLDFLGHKKAAKMIDAAIKSVTAEGRVLTPDLGGTAKTKEVTDAILANMRNGI